MTDSSSSPGAEEHVGTPRWVKAFGVVALVLVLLFLAVHLSGRGLGNHGPPGAHSSTVVEDRGLPR